MRQSVRRVYRASVAAAALLAVTVEAQERSMAVPSLQRAVFEVDLFDENGRGGGFDQFVFADGKLHTSEMRNLGCWSADYRLKPARGDASHFEAFFLTPEGQRIRVRGVVKGNTIEGSILWPESEDALVWTYSGRRVQGLLDGSRFDVEVTPDDPRASNDSAEDDEDNEDWDASEGYALLAELERGADRLVFERGGFESKSCAAVGMSLASYAAEESHGTITFAAQTGTEDTGLVEWSGDVEGDRIEGTLKWTTPDGSVVTYSFSGRRVTG